MERHIGAKVRRRGGRTKGPAKRTKEDKNSFEAVFVKLLERDKKEAYRLVPSAFNKKKV